MYEAIKNFAKQFGWEPRVENAGALKDFKRRIVIGMGGSHLAAGLLKVWNPGLDILIHRDYGLPPLGEETLRESMIIASSYSGNTEETIDAFEEAGRRGLARAAISVGGELLQRARASGVPYVQMPDTGIQPRSALGFSAKGLLKIMGQEAGLAEASALAGTLNPGAYEDRGKELADTLRGHIPVIYTSSGNAAVGYSWKIKFNETAKIPAFVNVFPELNHNEMTGFDVVAATRPLSEKFFFIFLKDAADHPKTIKRMEVTERLLRDRGFTTTVLEMEERNADPVRSQTPKASADAQAHRTSNGAGAFYKIFSSLVLSDWTAYYTAEIHGVEAEKVPMVEEFKRLIL